MKVKRPWAAIVTEPTALQPCSNQTAFPLRLVPEDTGMDTVHPQLPSQDTHPPSLTSSVMGLSASHQLRRGGVMTFHRNVLTIYGGSEVQIPPTQKIVQDHN